jgi:dUTP pyrophosphatase
MAASPQRYNWYSDDSHISTETPHPRTLLVKFADDATKDLYGPVPKNHATDSGFDLYAPEDITVPAHGQATLDHKVLCEPRFPSGYYLYPRSSISKTPLRLANSVGIIDVSYRGHIMAKVDNTSDTPYTIRRGDRLFQLCHPSLLPLHVQFADNINTDTARGAGGFGSTNTA